jgi:predicted DNA-binding protein
MIRMTEKIHEINSVSLPKELWQRLRKTKEETGVPISMQIRKAVEKMI